MAAHTDDVALGTASVVLPLRHPIHVAKSAATVDRLSDGRLVLGIASGDRDPEYPAFDVDPDERGRLVRESVDALRAVWTEEFPTVEGSWGGLDGELDVLPKPAAGALPLLPTGNARQSTEWIAENGDGWIFYHLPERTLQDYLETWRELTAGKPFVMAVRVVFADDPSTGSEPLHLGYRAGVEWFREYFQRLDEYGVDHVIVGLAGDQPRRAQETFATSVIEQV
jgi:luciferase-type oxidoreductase